MWRKALGEQQEIKFSIGPANNEAILVTYGKKWLTVKNLSRAVADWLKQQKIIISMGKREWNYIQINIEM